MSTGHKKKIEKRIAKSLKQGQKRAALLNAGISPKSKKSTAIPPVYPSEEKAPDYISNSILHPYQGGGFSPR